MDDTESRSKEKPMASAASAFASYRSAEAETLSQRDLLVRLFQGAERFLTQGRLAMMNKNWYQANEGCQKAKRILVELLSTLNFEVGGEIAERLRDIYLFLIGEIVEANVHHQPERLEALMPVLATLRSAWEDIPDKDANVTSLNQGIEATFSVRT